MARKKKEVVEIEITEKIEKALDDIVAEIENKPVTLISYTMGAVIPTMQYGNIQPSITVSAGSIQEAEDICLAHIENLFAIFMKKEEEVPPVVNVPKNVVEEKKVVVALKGSAFENAQNALKSATGEEAQNLVRMQIQKSVKLSEEEKKLLLG